MSLIRDPVNITSTGRQMMTAGGDITYTKATLYGQDISHLTKDQLESLTSIGNPLLTVPVGISDKSDNDNATTVVIEATFQNTNLKTDLPYTAVGFFAKRGDDAEKLVLVGVANPGAYLVATSPDGIATDALDIKVAIAIGDATSVTAVVDPAGSVTPATLNGAINNLSHDLTAKIDANQDSTAKALDTKVDKTAVADQLATKANQSDLDKTNAEVVKKVDSADVTAKLDTKADKTDVANSVKQLQSSIDSKADKSVVDAEIAKIDFTPYAKTVDVNSKLAGYTTTADLTKLLAGKRDISDSYSRAELDKKFLALSTDTSGKVSADQVATMITGKADKTAVDAELAKKANSADVYTKAQVDGAFGTRDSNISNATNLAKQAQATANAKANASDLQALRTSAFQIDFGKAGDDILSFRDEKIRIYNNIANVKNLPSMANTSWFYVITHTNDGWGSVTVISQDNCYWQNVLNGNTWNGWVKHATSTDISNLQNQINTKLNKTDTVNVVNSYDVNNNQNGALNKWPVTQAWYVDQTALRPFAEQINQLKGRRTVDKPDFNSLTDGGTYYVTNPSQGKNFPVGSCGNLFVSNGNGHRISQLYFPDDGSALFMRELDESTWHGWLQLATIDQVNNALNVANQANSALAAKANVTDVTKAQSTADSANANANGRLSVAGGNMNTTSVIQWNGGGIDDKNGNLGGITWNGGTDWAKIYGDQDDNDNLDLAFDLGDDGSNHFSFRQNGSETSAITSDGHYTGTVDWGHVNGRPQDQINKINTDNPLFRMITNSNNWNDIFGVNNSSNVLTSLRINAGGSGSLLNNFAAGIGFGGADTKGVLSVAYNDHQARITGGNGTSPVWSEDIAWKSDVNDLRNQVQQLRENQFEVQTFTDATAAANWEAQRPGKRMAIVNK